MRRRKKRRYVDNKGYPYHWVYEKNQMGSVGDDLYVPPYRYRSKIIRKRFRFSILGVRFRVYMSWKTQPTIQYKRESSPSQDVVMRDINGKL